jgi:hypothetical protein
MNPQYYQWKWSLGESYYKSARPEKLKTTDTNTNINVTIKNGNDSQLNAIMHSLNDYDNIDTNVTNVNANNNSSFENDNKREMLDNKMAGRELVLQRGANPFLHQTSYVNDIVVRDMFLKPINTTQGRVKNSEGLEAEN